MRVIHVCAYYAPAYTYGGPARSVHTLCLAQQALGMDVEVFTTTAAGRERLEASPDGRLFEGVRVRYFELSRPSALLGACDLGPALGQALADADVVHLHGLFNRTIWDAAARVHAHGARYVLSPRGMLQASALAHHRWRKRAAWRLRDRAIVCRADILHATSSSERETLRQFDRPSVVLIPNPVIGERVTSDEAIATRRALHIDEHAPIVLSLGRLHRIKRLDLVVAAFRELWARVPAARLIVAGPDEHGLQMALEAALGPARSATQFLGTVDGASKSRLLAASTVLVQASDSESFGMSVAEALATGIPVVVTRTCPWEDIEKWQCGFWVPQSSDAIAAALRRVIGNPGLAAEQGNAGRRLADERFSPRAVATAWHEVYQQLALLTPTAA